VELGREELRIIRKRAGDITTPARVHGHGYHDLLRAAGRLDYQAHLLPRLHDSGLGGECRRESQQNTADS
jgi:hypothetical protein